MIKHILEHLCNECCSSYQSNESALNVPQRKMSLQHSEEQSSGLPSDSACPMQGVLV